jgi:hypothetical protein
VPHTTDPLFAQNKVIFIFRPSIFSELAGLIQVYML